MVWEVDCCCYFDFGYYVLCCCFVGVGVGDVDFVLFIVGGVEGICCMMLVVMLVGYCEVWLL